MNNEMEERMVLILNLPDEKKTMKNMAMLA